MASTYKPSDAFDYAKSFMKNAALEPVQAKILDSAIKHLWMAAPWRWTLGSFTSPTIKHDVTDYTITSFPADFLYIESARLTDGENINRPLIVVPTLPVAQIYGQPSRIAYLGSSQIRLYPLPGNVQTTLQVLAMYKKVAPAITRSTMFTAGVQVVDDEWFWVFQEIVLWKAMVFEEDQRAGSVQVQGDKAAYTGQRAVVEDALNFMRASEPLLLEDGTEQDQRKGNG